MDSNNDALLRGEASDEAGTRLNRSLGPVCTRRSALGAIGLGFAAATLACWGFKSPRVAYADTALSFPQPVGALDDMIDGKKTVTCYSPSTVAGSSEMLGLNNPSFYSVEYEEYLPQGLSQSPTLGLWGSSWNDQCNPFLSNLVDRDEMGGEVDDDYVAVIGSALQSVSQHSTLDDSIGGIPLFMAHRPQIMAIDSTTSWDSSDTRTVADFVRVVNEFDPTGPYYKEGDENYDPYFVDFRAYYGEKLGYMYSTWDLAELADSIVAQSGGTQTLRYGSAVDIVAAFEQFMVASQYAILRAIDNGDTHRKTVAVVGGISDQTQGITNGVDLATGRARLDCFDPGESSFANSTAWGSTTNYNVRYYHASAALENCCDNIIDVVGASDASDTEAPIIVDENGIYWGRPEALMQCEAIIVRTQTTVSTIPGTDELYQILREYGYTNQNEWPDIYTSFPTIPGYGASNSGQYWWWSSYLGFVYPEVINPVHMAAYCCEEFYHVASSHLEDEVQLLYGEASLPRGYELTHANYNANDLKELFARGVEWYLFYKSYVDAHYVNLCMTDGMSSWVEAGGLDAYGLEEMIFNDVQTSDWGYDAIVFCAQRRLMRGYDDGTGNYGPYDVLTRAQAATVMCRYFTEDDTDTTAWNVSENLTALVDVLDNQWYTPFVNWAVFAAAMNGYDDGSNKFGPDDPITREQLCIIIGNVAEGFGTVPVGSVASASTEALQAMPDAADVDSWALQAVAWGLNNGVIAGVLEDGVRYLRPRAEVDRSTMATVIMNAINNGVI